MEEIIETTKMSTRGQVIIPKDVREYINARDDAIFTVVPLDKDTILMKKMDKKKLLQEFRKIRASIKKLSPDKIKNEIRAYRKA
jgi:bifunctional DNA-binding transcriptional regulator/antitoxin component of YhaV-PrlF toxin-antitoxin module